jgi:alpha-L-fucosidase
MRTNGEAIHGTQASPFRGLTWGRCTQKPVPGGTRLYLHVFDWPKDGRLRVAGLSNRPRGAHLLAGARRPALSVKREDDALVVTVPNEPPSPPVSVVALDIEGTPRVTEPPRIEAEFGSFVDALEVNAVQAGGGVDVRYTLDGSDPVAASPKADGPIQLTQTAIVSARSFRAKRPASGITRRRFDKVAPAAAVAAATTEPGLHFTYFEGDWDRLPDFSSLVPASQGESLGFDLAPRRQDDHFGFAYEGFVRLPADGVYVFSVESDDGSRLVVDGRELVLNDGVHAMEEREGETALAAGLHRLYVDFFEKTGQEGLRVSYKGPGLPKSLIPPDALRH